MKLPVMLRMAATFAACLLLPPGAAAQAVSPTQAAPANPANVRLHLYLEQAAEAMHPGDLESAAENLRRALGIDPHSLPALNNLGIVLAREGKPAEAIPLYQEALKFRPGDQATKRNLAVAYFKAQRYHSAWNLLQPMAVAYPTDFQILDLSGLCMFALDRYAEAARYLEREGIVERRRGAGTFVAAPKIHFNKLMSYSEHMSSRGLTPRSRVLVAKIIEHEPEVAARLGLPATTALVKIERLRETGDDPFALETCYLSAREFADLVHAPLGRVSLFATLEHDYGVDLAYADEEVDATAAEANIAELLSVPRGASVLRIRQVIYSSKGKATIYGVGYYRSERHTLFIRRFR